MSEICALVTIIDVVNNERDMEYLVAALYVALECAGTSLTLIYHFGYLYGKKLPEFSTSKEQPGKGIIAIWLDQTLDHWQWPESL